MTSIDSFASSYPRNFRLRYKVFPQFEYVPSRIRYKSRKAVPQKQALPVGLGLCDKREQEIAVFRQNLVNAEDHQRVCNIKHFGNRWRLFETPTSKRPRQPRNLSMKSPAASHFQRQNMPLPIN